MKTTEKSAYIKGLLDGTNLDTTTPEGKIIAALCDLCADFAREIETLRNELDVTNEYVEELDADLGDVEEIVYDDDDDNGCFFDDDDDEDEDDDECENCGGCDDEDVDDDEVYVAMCPNCGGKVYFDDSVDPEDVICPACQKPLIGDEDEDEGKDL